MNTYSAPRQEDVYAQAGRSLSSHTILQRVLSPLQGRPHELYFRTTGSAVPDELRRTEFHLGAGASIDFDTYFGALFESHWQAHAGPISIGLQAWVSSGLCVRLWRRFAAGSHLISETVADRDGDIALWVPPDSAPQPGSRLFVTVSTGGADGVLRDVCWIGNRSAKDVRLVIGICAYSDRARAFRSADMLATAHGLQHGIVRIIVVDQSGIDDSASEAACFDIVRQPNFGGSGGFARIMMEALATEHATHVVLFDDDVEIDPQVIDRVHALCALARTDFIVAGQMLDLTDPTVLHESGAILDRRRLRIVPNSRGIDLIEGLDEIGDTPRAEYAAWFFCTIPLAVIRRIGLPLPFFINFDDVEFGLRSMADGTSTISVAGIGVWHVPGNNKDDDWRARFYHCNIAVIVAVHGVDDLRGLTLNFVRRTIKSLLEGNIFKANLACDGIASFLAGPEAVPAFPAAVLHEIERRRDCEPSHWGLKAICALPSAGLRMCATSIRLAILGERASGLWVEKAHEFVLPSWWQSYLPGWGIAPHVPAPKASLDPRRTQPSGNSSP